MSRLIDANKVVKAILAERDKIPRTVPAASYELVSEKPFNHGNSMRGGIRKALRCIEQAPTVDAVPVVRCRECKHFNMQTMECENDAISTDHEGGASYSLNFYLDDFCSYGERKEGAD